MNTKYRTPILLVEDNQADADLIKIYLHEVGFKYELFHTDSLKEGLEIVNSKEIDIALLDLSLVDISGFKTLSKFVDSAPHVPVIVLTGLNNEIIGNQAVKAGAQDFLVKGQFDGKQLGRAIRYSLQRFKTKSKLESLARNLAINEKRFQEAQEMANFGNWEMDLVTYTMKWSQEMLRIFGMSQGSVDLSLSDYLNFVHFDDKEKVEAFFEEAPKNAQLHRLEHRIIVDGKSIKHVNLQARVYFDEFIDKALLIGAIQDITRQKMSEKLLFEKKVSSQAALIQQETISDLGFHIRTPLNSIVNLLFLLNNTQTSRQQKDHIKDLISSVDDLSIVTNQLINFSILSVDSLKLQKETINPRQLFEGISKIFKIKAAESGVVLKFIAQKDIAEKLHSDPNKISQLLFNLIEVGLKNARKGDRLAIEMKIELNERGEHNLNFIVAGAHLNKEMELDEHEIANFQSLNADEKANSLFKLNYAIAKKILDSLNGSIDISKGKNETVSLNVTFPIEIPKQVKFIRGEKPQFPVRILLVEDHILNQISTRKVLTSWSDYVEVDIAANGKIGLEKLEDIEYDLVLMDLQMPVMDGIEATKELRKTLNLPVIALTANSSQYEAEKCFKIGMNDYLAKPFKPEELYAKIMNVLVGVEH